MKINISGTDYNLVNTTDHSSTILTQININNSNESLKVNEDDNGRMLNSINIFNRSTDNLYSVSLSHHNYISANNVT